MGWWKGHAHWPGHWVAEFPTQTYADPVLRSEPWTPHRLMQNPSTATSWAVKTSPTPPFLGWAFAASSEIWPIVRYFPEEHPSSETWFVSTTWAVFGPPLFPALDK
ncbi:hypothetical protein ACMD2_12359 [Ananas comosus]|uniref:Uncharacterized protein n=1 Tax=Ananas comosus TaxID=4615 RepID=A0A199V6A2_ANACO|nr:hypothetical protein ACMD2_12359 [Ananas comosus]